MYLMTGTLTVSWAPDGAQSMTVPTNQSFQASVDLYGNASQGFVLVPGGNAPTGANLTSGVNSLAALISTYLNTPAVLAQIQGWSGGTD